MRWNRSWLCTPFFPWQSRTLKLLLTQTLPAVGSFFSLLKSRCVRGHHAISRCENISAVNDRFWCQSLWIDALPDSFSLAFNNHTNAEVPISRAAAAAAAASLSVLKHSAATRGVCVCKHVDRLRESEDTHTSKLQLLNTNKLWKSAEQPQNW